MDYSSLSAYELGETNNKEAIHYLVKYLERGIDNDKRLAASAVIKLVKLFPQECLITLPSLFKNLNSDKPQVRQYTLKAIEALPLRGLSKNELSLLKDIVKQDSKEYNRVIAERIIRQLDSREEKRNNYFPEGATRKGVEKAELASTQTTVELVMDKEPDAFYFRSLEQNGIKLNEPQLKATRHFKGPALVLAGAGSGKTRVLSSRAGYLLSVHNVAPNQLLLLTFTRKAAEEMKERISLLPGISKSMVRKITSGTYHSIFLKILRWQGEQRKVMDNEKLKHTFLKIIMKEMGLKQDDYEPETLLAILSHHKNNMIPVDDIPTNTPIEKEVKEILIKYERKKQENHLMDFDDILLDCYFLFKQNDYVLHRFQRFFTYILCDEWQDTNSIQYELIKMLARPQNNLFVVGDDDQTIFEFNGADSAIILNFNKQYPNTKMYRLDINYRSTNSIVGLANKIISFNQNRFNKTLKSTRESVNTPFYLRPKDAQEEAELIIETIKNDVRHGLRKYKDYAILFRTNSNSRAIFDEAVLNDIPLVTYGNSNTFYEQAIVKPVLDYLRLVVDGKDLKAVSGVLPSLYFNREKALDFIMKQELSNSKPILLLHLLDYPFLKSFQKNQLYERIKLLKQLTNMAPLKAVRKIRTFYDKYLEADERKRITMHKEMIQETLSEIESSASKFTTIPDFLDFVNEIIEKNKSMEELRKDPNADVVKLMTIHKSKGLEFPVVYMIGVSEGILPHSSTLEANNRNDFYITENEKDQAAIEGERRLAYVGVTRAEQELYISSPALHKNEKVEISRFIKEVFTESEPSKKEVLPKQRTKIQKGPLTENQVKRTKTTESFLVWECTSDSCDQWIRIRSYEDTVKETKECPVCKGVMKHGVKEIVIK